MRHRRVIAAVAGLTWSVGAVACSCIKWDPDFIAERAEIIFLGEVTSVDTAHPENMPRDTWGDNVAFPFNFHAIEKLKGESDNLRLFLIGPPSSCELKLAAGERRIFILSRGKAFVGWCNVVKPTETNLTDLKAAVKGKR